MKGNPQGILLKIIFIMDQSAGRRYASGNFWILYPFKKGPNPFKTNIHRMKQPYSYYCNDQAYIAGSFNLDEDYVNQMARLAYFKINSYKLSLVNAAFCASRDELSGIIRGSLLNYTPASDILVQLDFFISEVEN
jgi:hypothetical protein